MRLIRINADEEYHIFRGYIVITKNNGEYDRILPILYELRA